MTAEGPSLATGASPGWWFVHRGYVRLYLEILQGLVQCLYMQYGVEDVQTYFIFICINRATHSTHVFRSACTVYIRRRPSSCSQDRTPDFYANWDEAYICAGHGDGLLRDGAAWNRTAKTGKGIVYFGAKAISLRASLRCARRCRGPAPHRQGILCSAKAPKESTVVSWG